jgi:hypothetical protein
MPLIPVLIMISSDSDGRHKIRERQRHGEAASADMVAVAKERLRLQDLLSKYDRCDIFNADETGLFMYQQPNRGLSDKKMSGKKQSKARLSVLCASNADGSEKLELMIIGKSKQPRCFKRKTPSALGFYYRHNTKAWMKKDIFEEYAIS